MKTIPLFKAYTATDAADHVRGVLESGHLAQGHVVDQFEALLRFHFDSRWVNTLNSATSGLQLAVHMELDDWNNEVLTTPLTCTATNFAILAASAKIRWVDVDPKTGNMDVDDLSSKINPKTLAIMVVHWGGYPCELDTLERIQQRSQHIPPIIEDCAHAWGATYKGKPIGTHGNTCVFSFQAIKHLTTGDGGCMISPDEEHYRRAKLLRWYGLDRESNADFRCAQNVQEWGFKFHMNDIAAAIGCANIRSPGLNWNVIAHKVNGRYFNEHLKGIPGLTQMEDAPDRESSFWIYTVRVERRDDFKRKMAEHGIATSQVHARNDKHDCLREFRCHLPGMDILDREMICIPCGWWVNAEDREYIVDCIKGGW